MIASVEELLQRGNLLVTVGSGGVGKTTVSAALGLRAATLGRKVLVITIDPARRLATSLGLEETGNKIVEVNGAVEVGGAGSLHALMLDARSTFDELIVRISPDDAVRKRILNNRIYRLLSESIAGSHNVMATEKLYEIVRSAAFDLVVLDTPPTSNALDFLESSGYLARFLDDRVMGWFLPDPKKKGIGARIFSPVQNIAGRLLGLLFGQQFMDDLTDFFDAFGGLYRGFRHRAEEVKDILKSADTSFAVVCTPRAMSLRETGRLAGQLSDSDHPVRAWFVNQCGPYPGRERDATGNLLSAADREELTAALHDLDVTDSEGLLAAMESSYGRAVAGSDTDAGLLRELGPDASEVMVTTLPRLDDEVVELASLQRFGRLLGQ